MVGRTNAPPDNTGGILLLNKNEMEVKMATFRVNKTKNYTVMSNYHFKDKTLSLKAKGLLSQMLSLPDDWDYSIAGLCAINKESKPAITSALNELKQAGYLVVTKLMPDQTKSGRIEYVYDIYEKPSIEKQGIENQCLVSQVVKNITQLNTKKLSTNKQNTNNTIPKGIEQAPESYGNAEINELFDEWEKNCGFKIDTKIKQNRYACQRLIKQRGFEQVKKVIKIVEESQNDQYAPGINNFMDLAEKWNNLAIWYKKKNVTNSMRYGKIVIPSNERNNYGNY